MLEALKNLALAGLGRLTLTMDEVPTNTFFDLRDEPLAQQLKLMNPDLQIAYADEPKHPADVVIVTVDSLPKAQVENVLVLVIGSRGMQGVVDLKYNGNSPIPILQPHPPAGLNDVRYRAGEIWPEYQAFCDRFDLDTLNETEHRHVPYCVLLVKALAQTDTTNVKTTLDAMQQFPDEENFAEAKAQLWRLNAPAVPKGIMDIIEFANSGHLTKVEEEEPFWVLVKALEHFVRDNKCLPVTGEIPDMISGSNEYIELKRIYKEKAKNDATKLAASTTVQLPASYVQSFCENSKFLRVMVPQPLVDIDYSDYLEESSELAPVAALIGGIAGQEAMKLLMGQYTPLNGALFYDGLTQQSKIIRTTMKIIN